MEFRGVYEPMFFLQSSVDGHVGGIHFSLIITVSEKHERACISEVGCGVLGD